MRLELFDLQVASRKAMEDGMKALIRKTVKDPEVGTATTTVDTFSLLTCSHARSLTHSLTHSLTEPATTSIAFIALP